MSEQSIYAKAIEWLQGRWGQGHLYVCLEGALNIACHGTMDYCDTGACKRTGWKTIGVLGQAVGTTPCVWNDAPKRTVEDVLLLLKYADAGELETWSKLYGPESGGEA